MVKKQFACIKPLFDFKDKNYYSTHKFQTGLSYFQQNRTYFEKDYASATIESVDKNLKPITNSIGLPINASGAVLVSTSDITNRINEITNHLSNKRYANDNVLNELLYAPMVVLEYRVFKNI